MDEYGKIVIVTQKTWLDLLIERFNTKEQARFYLEHQGISFTEYQNSNDVYYYSLRQLKQAIPRNQKFQVIEKAFLPNFLFNRNDLIVVLGRDGLVVNTAKYLDQQPIIAINPDISRIEGILLPFDASEFEQQLNRLNSGNASFTHISLAEAKLNTGQVLIGVNDIFIGHQSHQSARYVIKFRDLEEQHSSSGVIVSTGLGSTGWYKSIVTGAIGIVNGFRSAQMDPLNEWEFTSRWDANFLHFCVREPWSSKISGSNIIYGRINTNETLRIESQMPERGVIFSDGIEEDYLEFQSGAVAHIGLSDKKVKMVVKTK
ncbi:MAG: sugar kinase [Candidatus Heimdallarchaeota archaeon]|nr:sugar kinase [Candidatus Heimdallarchaeota archaeon]